LIRISQITALPFHLPCFFYATTPPPQKKKILTFNRPRLILNGLATLAGFGVFLHFHVVNEAVTIWALNLRSFRVAAGGRNFDDAGIVLMETLAMFLERDRHRKHFVAILALQSGSFVGLLSVLYFFFSLVTRILAQTKHCLSLAMFSN
jgi:hypothetical protein